MSPLGLPCPSPLFFVPPYPSKLENVFLFVFRIAVFLWEPLPADFIPPPPHAVSACGEVNDVDHGDQNGAPSI